MSLENLLEYKPQVDATGEPRLNKDGSPMLDTLNTALLRVVKPGETRVKDANGKIGLVQSVGADGAMNIWFGKRRDADWRNEDGKGMAKPCNSLITEERSFRDVDLAD